MVRVLLNKLLRAIHCTSVAWLTFFVSQGTIIAVAAFLFLMGYGFMLRVKDKTYSQREKNRKHYG